MTVTGGLVVLVYAIVKAQSYGWGSAKTIGLLAGAVALLGAFLSNESRSAAPLMRLSIFRVRALAVADAVLLLVASGMFGMFFFASLYVQQILGYSPLKAGLAFLPVTAGIVIGAGVAQQLIKRVGVRNVSTFGIALASAGMLVLTQLPVHGSYVSDLLVGLLPMSLGMGLTFVPITLLGTSGVTDRGRRPGQRPVQHRPAGRRLARAGDPLHPRGQPDDERAARRQPVSGPAARVSGYHVAFLAAAIMLAAGVVIMAFALRRRHMREVERAIEAGVQPMPA